MFAVLLTSEHPPYRCARSRRSVRRIMQESSVGDEIVNHGVSGMRGQVQRVGGWGQVLGASLREEVEGEGGTGEHNSLPAGGKALEEWTVPICAVAQIGTGDFGR